jgi:hypothetical protein
MRAAGEVGWARRRIVGKLAPTSQRRGRARALLSMLFGRRDALLLGEGMNMFWSFAASSPSTTPRVFFRGRGLSRQLNCRRLQARKGEAHGQVQARGSSSPIQAAAEMGCIEGAEEREDGSTSSRCWGSGPRFG